MLSPPSHAPPTRRRVGILPILASAALLLACGEAPLLTPLSSSSAKPDAQRSALQTLTRNVAVGLADPLARQSVLADLRDATANDHKLELRAYLTSARGQDLLGAMSSATGRSPAELIAQMNQIRPLQLYMPVAAHRAQWTGDAGLYVAGVIGRKDTPIAYDLAGEPVTLSATTPPETPTLGLVPTERLRPDSRILTPRRAASTSATTLVPSPPLRDSTCMDDCPITTLPRPAKVPGIYMDKMTIRDAHEFWLRQSPEVDLVLWSYVHGGYVFNGRAPVLAYFPPSGTSPTSPGYWPGGFRLDYRESFVFDPNIVRRVYTACAGEAATYWRRFDFNSNGDNTPPWGQALLAATTDFGLIEAIADPAYPNAPPARVRRVALTGPFEVEILERDDGTECPAPPRYFEASFTAGYRFDTRMQSYSQPYYASGFGWQDLAALFGNNNDQIAIFHFATAAQLEALDHTFLPGQDADIVLSSYNFHVADIPTTIDPYP